MTNIIGIWYNDIINFHPHILSKCFVEFIGMLMFHFIGSLSQTAITNGTALIVIVYYTSKISGSHLNPAISLTFTLLGHTNPLEMLFYWIAQIMGCIFASLFLILLVPGLYFGKVITSETHLYDGCFFPNSTLSKSQIFGFETLATLFFIVPIFSVVWFMQNKTGYGTTGPFIVGTALMCNAFAISPFTMASLNPARTIASQVVFSCKNSYLLYYILGEFFGAILAVLFIFPFYGISNTPWYNYNDRIKKLLLVGQKSINLRTYESNV